MCLLLAVRRSDELWLGANRDERLDRAWEPPTVIVPDPPVFGGRDLVGGGSWLAVNVAGAFVVAVTSARLWAPPGERSRGQLVLEAASQRTLGEAVALCHEVDLMRYGPFNLLLADASSAFLCTNVPQPVLRRAEESLIAVGNDCLDDPGPRTRIAALQMSRLADLSAVDLEQALVRLLSDHDGPDPFCRHGERYGTVCSSVIRITTGAVIDFAFAPGPACTTPLLGLPLPRQ